MSEFGGTKPTRFDCPACYERMEVAFDQRYSTLTCPRCGRLVQLGKHQIFWANLKQVWWPGFKIHCSRCWGDIAAWWSERRARRKAQRAMRLEQRRQQEDANRKQQPPTGQALQQQQALHIGPEQGDLGVQGTILRQPTPDVSEKEQDSMESDSVARPCDVCGKPIPADSKHYPLDSGRSCCAACWAEVRDYLGGPRTMHPSAPVHIEITQPKAEGRASERKRWSGCAIAAFVLAILSVPVVPVPAEMIAPEFVCLNFALAGLVVLLAFIGISATSQGEKRGRGLATAALIMQLIWLIIIFARLHSAH